MKFRSRQAWKIFEGSENSDSYEKRVDSYFIRCRFTRVKKKKKKQKKDVRRYSVSLKIENSF